ncbi:MAG: hypothetical protein ACOYEV_12865 [Candidatus Nanopelagicales bacterium]
MSTPEETEVDRPDYVTCAFCSGRGRDPFAVMSALSTCSVCGGAGENFVPEPRVECAFCKATGVQLTYRVTCTGCVGKGMHTVRVDAETCPVCAGTGVAPDSPKLPCAKCRGAGVS